MDAKNINEEEHTHGKEGAVEANQEMGWMGRVNKVMEIEQGTVIIMGVYGLTMYQQ